MPILTYKTNKLHISSSIYLFKLLALYLIGASSTLLQMFQLMFKSSLRLLYPLIFMVSSFYLFRFRLLLHRWHVYSVLLDKGCTYRVEFSVLNIKHRDALSWYSEPLLCNRRVWLIADANVFYLLFYVVYCFISLFCPNCRLFFITLSLKI